MATNVTTDHIKYMEQQLKNKQIHLEKAIQRMTRFNEVTLPAKKNNPRNKNKKHIQDREPIDIESKPEVINLRRAIAHYEYAIEAMKEKQKREELVELFDKLGFKEASVTREIDQKQQKRKITFKKRDRKDAND